MTTNVIDAIREKEADAHAKGRRLDGKNQRNV